ncbi:MAG: OstA-like protein [Saprospiraceae bacterium]
MKNKIYINNAENMRVTIEEDTVTQYLNGVVKVYHDSTFFFSDTAIVKDNSLLFAYNNVAILQNDSINIFCDTLTYSSISGIARLINKVLLRSNNKRLITNELIYDVHNKIATYNTGAVLKQDESTLKSEVGVFLIKEDLIHFNDNVVISDKSFNLKSDSLDFNTKEKEAVFKSPTFIEKDSTFIYCEGGFYNLKSGNAEFRKNAQFRQDSSFAEADIIKYNDSLQVYTLIGNAKYTEKNTVASADKMTRDEKNKIIILDGNAYYKSETQTAKGEKLIFDENTEEFISEGRSTIIDNSLSITADYTEYSKKQKKGKALGNVEFIDTSSNIILNAISLTFDNSENYILAYGDTINHLLMRMISYEDTTYLSADTLLSNNIIVDNDTVEVLLAYNNVRIYNEGYQAITDSLVNYTQDSIYVLYHNPVMWSEDTQITGDTINMYLKNKKLDKIFTRKNAFITNFIAGSLYNQIKGKMINILFENDSLRYLNVNGNAESIYHMEDENKALTGTIKTVCSSIDFYFKDNEIKDIKFNGNPKSNSTPIKQEILNPQILSGFKWYSELRPSDKNDVFPVKIVENESIPVQDSNDKKPPIPDMKKEKNKN